MAEGPAERLRLASLRDGLLMKLRHLPWDIVLNGPEARHPGNLNVEFRGFNAENILSILQPGVAASTGSACISGEPEPSYVLRAIGLSYDAASSSIRFGVGRETTEQDITDAVSLIESALQKIDLEAA
jgi:cysteine desulfurase